MTRAITQPSLRTRHAKNPSLLPLPAEENLHNSSSGEDDYESDLESPTKRYKGMVSAAINMTPSRRSVGGHTKPNSTNKNTGNRVVIDNTSILRSWTTESSSREVVATSSVTGESVDDVSDDISHTTEGSGSVAHLRGWLDDFGRQQKQHYTKNQAIGQAPEDAQRPTRPKMSNTARHKPTPLPPPAASALARRMVEGRGRTTPIRLIQTQETSSDVRATNEGYKSVKELSAWLADDPTKTKKRVKCLRRGANVIAKSRAFDKGLKDVIIEQDLGLGPTVKGLVASKKQLLAPSLSAETGSTCGGGGEEMENVHAQEWPALDALETSSAVSVSSKKQWLAGAFKKAGSTVDPKAHTEVITAQDERDAVSNRAKHLWRQRALNGKKTTATGMTSATTLTFTQKSVAARKNLAENTSDGNIRIKKQVVVKPVDPTVVLSLSNQRTWMANKRDDRSSVSESLKTEPSPATSSSPTKYGFSAAREYLVQKSRLNGNPVDVGKVKNRTAKFERLDARRKSQPTLLKTAWVMEPADVVFNSGRPGTAAFVQTVVTKDVAPKKSLQELP